MKSALLAWSVPPNSAAPFTVRLHPGCSSSVLPAPSTTDAISDAPTTSKHTRPLPSGMVTSKVNAPALMGPASWGAQLFWFDQRQLPPAPVHCTSRAQTGAPSPTELARETQSTHCMRVSVTERTTTPPEVAGPDAGRSVTPQRGCPRHPVRSIRPCRADLPVSQGKRDLRLVVTQIRLPYPDSHPEPPLSGTPSRPRTREHCRLQHAGGQPSTTSGWSRCNTWLSLSFRLSDGEPPSAPSPFGSERRT